MKEIIYLTPAGIEDKGEARDGAAKSGVPHGDIDAIFKKVLQEVSLGELLATDRSKLTHHLRMALKGAGVNGRKPKRKGGK